MKTYRLNVTNYPSWAHDRFVYTPEERTVEVMLQPDLPSRVMRLMYTETP
jgi:hypothetical protein